MAADVVGIRINLTGWKPAVTGIDAVTESLTAMGAAADKAATATAAAMGKVASTTKVASGEVADANTVAAGSYDRVAESADAAAASSGAAAGGATKAGTAARTGSVGLGKYALVTGAATYAMVDFVKKSSTFNQSMEMIHTQAQVPQAAIKGLSTSVLGLAKNVGTGPDTLAQGLYHIESAFQSTGISGQKALALLTTSAKGAKIGNADLVDVTNALDAAVVAGIPGAQNYNKAMGMLNATVGAGDMKMQDLADAMGTGVAVIAKEFGLSLNNVGSALATFGDNNIRGAKAGTELRMSIMDLAKQSTVGATALASIGITSGELATDMQKGGLTLALTDLKDKLNAAGITGTKVGAFLEDAFTKKASAPLAILLGQITRYDSKQNDIAVGASKFGADWTATAQTAQQQSADLGAAWDALAIKVGEVLTPPLITIEHILGAVFGWFAKNKTAAAVLGGALLGLAAGGLAALTVGLLTATATIAGIEIAVAPAIIILGALGASGYLLATHWKDIWARIKKDTQDGVNDVYGIINWFIGKIDAVLGVFGVHINKLSPATFGNGPGAGSVPSSTRMLDPNAFAPNYGNGGFAPNSAIGIMSGGKSPSPYMASGGITNGPMAIVGEGNQAHPEYVIPTDPTHRTRALGLYQSLGAQLMDKGGILGDVTGFLGDVAKGAFGFLDVAGAAFGSAKSAVAKPFEEAALGLAGNLPPGIMQNVAKGAITAIYDMIIGSGGGGGSSASGGAQSVGAGINSPAGFAGALLSGLGDPQTAANLKSLVAWENMEGGAWHNSAAFNPLNTTLKMPGSHSMNSVGVQAYTGWPQGLDATEKTLSKYGQILSALSAGAGLTQPMADLARWSGGGYNAIKLAAGGTIPYIKMDTGGALPMGRSLVQNDTGGLEFPNPQTGGGQGQTLTVNVVLDNKVVGQATLKYVAGKLARQ